MKSRPPSDGLKVEGSLSDGLAIRPKKRLRRLKDHDQYLHSDGKKSVSGCMCG